MIATAVIVAVLSFVPLISTPILFSLTAATYGPDDIGPGTGLFENDLEQILNLVSEHESFGRLPEYPSRISLVDVLFKYDSFGLIAIGLRPIGIGLDEVCPDCKISAFVGLSPGPHCLFETTIFLFKSSGAWQISDIVNQSSQWPKCAS